MRTERGKLIAFRVFAILTVLLLCVAAFAQETTGGLQGTVRDPKGAVVPKAQVEVTGTSLVGAKKLDTDASGYYRFANLPPGIYTLTVKATGFSTLKRDGIDIAVGHLPTLDIDLKVGSTETVVEVTGEAPLIDTTTTRTLTNITEDVVADVPHGRSYQSVIQFAPSARNEPLGGSAVSNQSAGGSGNGGNSPGNGGNGQTFGLSVSGGADSENAYLVEGQSTASPIGGTAQSNVPFEFIQEVQVKSSGIEAEHGGAMGGVVNVIMKKGSNEWHGQAGLSYEADGLDAGDTASAAYVRYDPLKGQSSPAGWTYGRRQDSPVQVYQPKKDHFRTILPSFQIGGPVVKDRLFAFAAFAPEYFVRNRTVNFGPNNNNAGIQQFGRDRQTYYSNGRLDFRATSKLNLFASWMYQYQREVGASMPNADPVGASYYNADNTINQDALNHYNSSVSSPMTNYMHGIGFAAPNATYNFGGDFTITPQLVATTRFGYFFENYHDFGAPNGTIFQFTANGTAASTCTTTDPSSCADPTKGGTGVLFTNDPAASQLLQTTGYTSAYLNQDYTLKNANKHYQLDQDIAWFKSGWMGTHNFKFGYQWNKTENDIDQRTNGPLVNIIPGSTSRNDNYSAGVGTYGQMEVFDAGTGGKVHSVNHSFFAQDAWTVGHGLTINAGIRFEHENVPLSSAAIAAGDRPLLFDWGSKIAPRLGAAWAHGNWKIFGSFGYFYDQMKLNLAISSFGGQWWNSCFYQLNNPDILHSITVVPGADGRYCSGTSDTAPAAGNLGAGNVFMTNANMRAPSTDYFAKGLKPYKQHESVFGADYQLRKDLALEVRWDRRRLDNAIEDTATSIQDNNEIWQVVNPGQGINKVRACPDCPMNITAERSYDGVEVRLSKSPTHGWGGMFSYTYSRLYGNYSGLTNTDQTDGGGGRNSPNNGRAFDEPYFQFDAYGKSSSGLLQTDRPNTFKGYGFYRINEGKKAATTLGIFQTMYQGTPISTYIDVGGGGGGYGVFPEGRNKWADITQDPATGILTVTGVRSRRTPWYNQTDFNFAQEFKTNRNNEKQVLEFSATVSNLFNQHAPLVYGSQINSRTGSRYLLPGGKYLYGDDTQASYNAFEHSYTNYLGVTTSWKDLLNTNFANDAGVFAPRPILFNTQYGQALAWQQARNIRLAVKYTF